MRRICEVVGYHAQARMVYAKEGDVMYCLPGDEYVIGSFIEIETEDTSCWLMNMKIIGEVNGN